MPVALMNRMRMNVLVFSLLFAVTAQATPGYEACKYQRVEMDLGAPGDAWILQGPSIVRTGDGRFSVFVQGYDNQLWVKVALFPSDGKMLPKWGTWRALGGNITSRPSAVVPAPGRVEVFARSASYGVSQFSYAGGVWSPPVELSGLRLASAPAVAPSFDPGTLEMVAIGPDSGLWQRSFDGVRWSSWVSRGGNIYGSPALSHYPLPSAPVELYVSDPAGQLLRRTYARTESTTWWGFPLTTLGWGPWKPTGIETNNGVGVFPYQLALRSGKYSSSLYLGSSETYSSWIYLGEAGSEPSFADATGEGLFWITVARSASSYHLSAWVQYRECSICGDGVCGAAEETWSCYEDCGRCGDGICVLTNEACGSCAADCGACTCGNGRCEAGESCRSCSGDCGGKHLVTVGCTSGVDCRNWSEVACDATEAISILERDRHVLGCMWNKNGCPPPLCAGGATPNTAEWCCRDTGSTYYGYGCTQAAADDGAKNQNTACTNWQSGLCPL